jgi:hypothetical protein
MIVVGRYANNITSTRRRRSSRANNGQARPRERAPLAKTNSIEHRAGARRRAGARLHFGRPHEDQPAPLVAQSRRADMCAVCSRRVGDVYLAGADEGKNFAAKWPAGTRGPLDAAGRPQVRTLITRLVVTTGGQIVGWTPPAGAGRSPTGTRRRSLFAVRLNQCMIWASEIGARSASERRASRQAARFDLDGASAGAGAVCLLAWIGSLK